MENITQAAEALASAAHLVEAILCDDLCYESPRNLVLLRLAARHATDVSVIEKNLVAAAAFCDGQRPFKWRDAMRSHFELAEFRLAQGDYVGCAASLKSVLENLKGYFSPGNHFMAKMHRVRAFCLRSSGCAFGAEREEEVAAWMDRGGR